MSQTFKFPDIVLIDSINLGVFLGVSEEHPDQGWVATLSPDGQNQFTWVELSRLARMADRGQRTLLVVVQESLGWIRMIAEGAKNNWSLEDSESDILDTVYERTTSLLEQVDEALAD